MPVASSDDARIIQAELGQHEPGMVPGVTRPIPLVTDVLRRTARCFAGRVSELAMVRAAVRSVTQAHRQ
jgi:hypothetical protein